MTSIDLRPSAQDADLDVALRDGDDDHVLRLIGDAPDHGSLTADGLYRNLRETRSRQIRNTVAVAIADRRPPGADQVLSEVLARASVAPEAGTLVYALDEVGGTLAVSTLATLIEHGSYEARAEAILMLEAGRVAGSMAEVGAVRARLSALATSSDIDVAEAAEAALDRWPMPAQDAGP